MTNYNNGDDRGALYVILFLGAVAILAIALAITTGAPG